MAITPIQGGISSGATKVAEAIKDAAVWTGHLIVNGFNKLVDLIKSAWSTAVPFLKDAAIKTGNALRTGPGIGLLAAGAGIVLAFSASQMNDKKWVALAMQISAYACFIGAGVAVGIGIANGYTVPLF